jgi:hypothetical protein
MARARFGTTCCGRRLAPIPERENEASLGLSCVRSIQRRRRKGALGVCFWPRLMHHSAALMNKAVGFFVYIF